MATPITQLPIKAYRLLICLGTCFQSVLLLIFRLNWGWQFFQTGKGKLGNIDGVTEFFASLGIPAPHFHAIFVSSLECFGGLLLLIGLCSRPIAVMLAGSMVVAYLSVADDRATVLNVFNDAKPFFDAAPFFFLLTCTLIIAFGPGWLSVDGLLKKKFFGCACGKECCCQKQ